MTAFPSFEQTLKEHNIDLKRNEVTTLQINIGKICNQACHHCHVESGPKHPDNMSTKTVDRLLELLDAKNSVETVDITGGAPEMNPNFRYFVKELRKRGINYIDRCNLTILFEPGQEDTAQFLADTDATIVASLPCYLQENVDGQRGKGVFDKSIKALQLLNSLGYGKDKQLDLVYNPTGFGLPPDQHGLEADYKQRLKDDWGIEFNNLYTITNMPIKRFKHVLEREGKMEEYMQALLDSFNPMAARGVMCTNLISVSYDGKIFDCDFNQMLEMPINWQGKTIWDISSVNEMKGGIALADHCYGCTAGAGSSCTGAVT